MKYSARFHNNDEENLLWPQETNHKMRARKCQTAHNHLIYPRTRFHIFIETPCVYRQEKANSQCKAFIQRLKTGK